MTTGASAWIFQAHPRDWDIDRYLDDVRAGRVDARPHWLVTRYANDIAVGDRVFLWRAGPNRDAGVVALARVIGGPAERPDDKPDYRVNSAKFKNDRVRAKLEIERVLARPVRRPQLSFDPELRDTALLRSPQGTNFPLTDPEARALERLTEGR